MPYKTDILIDVPPYVDAVLSRLTAAGYEAYLVGGCVRDALRGVSPHDYDITTSALPEEMLSVFQGMRTIETGIKHGTLTVLSDGESVEVTTYRVDGVYLDHRRPESVCFTTSLRDDLCRRDFTINAMAYHPVDGLFDPFGGILDLRAGIIRAVGEPHVRFSEDALRILRALRFSARLGFLIEEETAAAARSLANTLTGISAERVRDELLGILVAPEADAILSGYADILAVVLPEGCAEIPFSKLAPADIPLRLAAYLMSAGRDAAGNALLRLRADRATIRAVTAILSVCEAGIPRDDEGILRALRAYGREALLRAMALAELYGEDVCVARARCDALCAAGACYTLAMLAVSGDDLAAIGIPRGKEMGAALEGLLTAVIRGECPNEKGALLALAKKTIA